MSAHDLIAKWRQEAGEYEEAHGRQRGDVIDWEPPGKALALNRAADELEAALAAPKEAGDGDYLRVMRNLEREYPMDAKVIAAYIARLHDGIRRLAAPSKEAGALDELTREQERLGLYAVPQADQQGDWYVSKEGSVTIDFDSGTSQRQLAILCKRDGSVTYVAYIDGDKTIGNAVEPEFFDVLRRLAAKPSDQQGASLGGDVGRLAAAVLWAREEWADKEHVARCRGDIPLADYYGRCKDSMNAALASKASPDDQRQEGEWARMTFDGYRVQCDPAIQDRVECALLTAAFDELSEREAASPPTEAAAAVGGLQEEVWRASLNGGLPEHIRILLIRVYAALSPTASAAREDDHA